MKILLFGKNGMLGKAFLKYHNIDLAVDKEECDIRNREQVFKLINDFKPTLIINCAALAYVDYCETHEKEAWDVNFNGVMNINDAAKLVGAFFVTFSSDVAINLVNIYGKTKQACEKEVSGLVIRLSYLYDENHWIFKNLREGHELNLYENVHLNPISTFNLSKITMALCNKKEKGVINVGTESRVSMFEFGNLIAKYFGYNNELIKSSTLNSLNNLHRVERYLNISKLNQLGLKIFSIEKDLVEFKNRIQLNPGHIKMKICLIQPPNIHLINDHVEPPLGLLSIASVLEQNGYEVIITDLTGGVDWDEIPFADVYGISVCSVTLSTCQKLADKCKEINSKSMVVVGGPHPTHVHENYNFDSIIIGEGEYAMLDLLKDFKQGQLKQSYEHFIDDLDELPIPAYHLISDYNSYCREINKMKAIGILTTRGCPYHCTFCPTNRKLRFRDPEKIIEEIRYLKKNFNISNFNIHDDIFVLKIDRLTKICNAFKKMGVHFRCNSRVGQDSPEIYKLLKESGCEVVGLGIESGSQEILDKMNKLVTLEQCTKSIKMAQEAGLIVRCYFIYGFPGETEETVNKTINFIKLTQSDQVGLSTFIPYPGCDVWDNPGEYGVTQIERKDFDLYYTGNKEGLGGYPFKTKYLTDDEFYKYQKLIRDFIFSYRKDHFDKQEIDTPSFKKKKIMLFGKNGKLGSTFNKLENIDCALSHNDLDITDREKVLAIVNKIKPDVIINCVAIADIDYCENNLEQARDVNVEGVKNICDAASQIGAYVVHFSSDAAINPINEYGRTKLASEKFFENNFNGVVIRLTLYNKDDWLLKSLFNYKKINTFTDLYLNPISTVSIIDIVTKLINLNYKGVINVGTKDKVNMYEFGKLVCEIFNLPLNLITSSSSDWSGVSRNKERYLSVEKLESLGIVILTLEEDLKIYKDNM